MVNRNKGQKTLDQSIISNYDWCKISYFIVNY